MCNPLYDIIKVTRFTCYSWSAASLARPGVQEFRSSGVQEFRSSGVQEFSVARHAGLQAETVGARYGFHRAGTDVRLLELLGLVPRPREGSAPRESGRTPATPGLLNSLSAIGYWLFAQRMLFGKRH